MGKVLSSHCVLSAVDYDNIICSVFELPSLRKEAGRWPTVKSNSFINFVIEPSIATLDPSQATVEEKHLFTIKKQLHGCFIISECPEMLQLF